VAASSAALWNFLFVPPYFTFHVQRYHDGIMFVVFFVVALAMGHLTSRLRRSEIVERQREGRTAALYELAQQAAFATDLDTGLGAAVNLIDSIFAAKAALFVRQKDHLLSAEPHAVSSFELSDRENSVAAWVFSHRVPAGKFTEYFPDAEALHMPLEGRTAVMGVLSVDRQKTNLLTLPKGICSKHSQYSSGWCLKRTISSKRSSMPKFSRLRSISGVRFCKAYPTN
jgi:two-component system sensor histidine kinase KdpD